jgi:hypothetical protein
MCWRRKDATACGLPSTVPEPISEATPFTGFLQGQRTCHASAEHFRVAGKWLISLQLPVVRCYAGRTDIGLSCNAEVADPAECAYLLKRAMPASLLCFRSLAAPNLTTSAAASGPALDCMWLRLPSKPLLLPAAASVSSAGRDAASVLSCRCKVDLSVPLHKPLPALERCLWANAVPTPSFRGTEWHILLLAEPCRM